MASDKRGDMRLSAEELQADYEQFLKTFESRWPAFSCTTLADCTLFLEKKLTPI